MSKSALITGASRGIGKATAIRLAREGYDLYLTCLHSEAALQELSCSLRQKYGVSVTAEKCDMSSSQDVAQLFTQIHALDVLVNNAGISYIGLLSDMTVEQWHHVIDTNLSSVFYTCKYAVPLMLHNHKGHILNITSVWGSVGASMETAYSASKGGVNALTKALARELAPSGISVNAISCGYIDTDMNAEFSQEEVAEIVAEIPCDRIGTTEEVAEMIHCVLQMPSYTTGQIFTIDGGWQNI